MTKTLVYATNTNLQIVADKDSISFGTPMRTKGNSCKVYDDVIISGHGLYKCIANITFVGIGKGKTTISFFKDGIEVPGASATVTTVQDNVGTVTIPFVIRNAYHKDSRVVANISGIAISVINSSITIEK